MRRVRKGFRGVGVKGRAQALVGKDAIRGYGVLSGMGVHLFWGEIMRNGKKNAECLVGEKNIGWRTFSLEMKVSHKPQPKVYHQKLKVTKDKYSSHVWICGGRVSLVITRK